jgi:hypothetical protein
MKTIAELEPDMATRVGLFFARMTDLSLATPIELVVDDLLEMLVAITRGALAYIEAPAGNRVFRAGHPRGDVDSIRHSVSRGIIQAALTARRTICTPGALNDDRFADLRSVQQHEIGPVVCAPIKVHGLTGVVYLQAFSELTALHRELVERLARELGRRFAWPITFSNRMTMDAATDAFRRWFALEILEGCGWKGTAAAEALGISRSTLYELVGNLRTRRGVSTG